MYAPATADARYQQLLAMLADALDSTPTSQALLLIEVSDLSELHARIGFAQSAALMQALGVHFASALQRRGPVVHFRDGSFCALVSDTRNIDQARLAADKLSLRMKEVLTRAGVHTLAAHIGIALTPLHGTEPEELLRKALLAATAARKHELDMQIFNEGCAAEVLQHWALTEAFTTALDAGELSMFYQPKVRIADGCCTGAEALMRWLRDGQSVASPDIFIPIAEKSGLIHTTTWFALSNALRQAASLGSLPVAVNISPAVLLHREFLDMVRSATSNWRTQAGHLTLEITEGALIADFDKASSRLSRLRDLGVRVSIDDFGTGYSSLSYFKKIPADELKIDKSFVSRMLQEPADRRLVETIVMLAQQRRLEIVAEGVEDQATLEALASIGCDYAQGYLFAPALHADAFRRWLAGRNLRPRGVTESE